MKQVFERPRWRAFRVLAGALVVIAALSHSAQSARAADAALPPEAAAGPAVNVVEARVTVFDQTILVTGSLAARKEVLVSPQIEGYQIEEVMAEAGDRVEKGQLLARLADGTLKAQLARLRAALDQSEAAIAQARSQIKQAAASRKQANAAFERAKQLLQTRAGTRASFDEKEAAAISADAELTLAKDGLTVAQAAKTEVKAQIAEAELRLSYTQITAPQSGIVSRRTAKAGGVASSMAEPLFTITADSEIELEAEVSEIYLPRLSAGQTARIEIAGLSPVTGTVRLISPEVDRATRLGKVRIFIGRNDTLRIGSFARAVINTERKNAIGVPSSSVLRREGTDIVLVVKGGRVETRRIVTGIRNGAQVEVLDGLEEGEHVVLRSGALLRNGDTVRPVLTGGQTVSEATQ